jgi:hypothetical protein
MAAKLFEDDPGGRAEVEAGFAELDAGEAISIEDFEREMDAFMASLPLGGGR